MQTGSDSAMTVAFANDSRLQMSAYSFATLHEDSGPNSKSAIKGLIELLRGRLSMTIRDIGMTARIRATTSTAVVGVRGTEFFIVAEEEQTEVGVYQGTVIVANIRIPDQTVQVAAGSKTIVYAGRPPLPPEPLSTGEGREIAGGDSALDRIEDTAVEATEQLPIEKYIAFPDLFIDAIRNPAYAGRVEKTEARVFGQAKIFHNNSRKTPEGFALAGA